MLRLGRKERAAKVRGNRDVTAGLGDEASNITDLTTVSVGNNLDGSSAHRALATSDDLLDTTTDLLDETVRVDRVSLKEETKNHANVLTAETVVGGMPGLDGSLELGRDILSLDPDPNKIFNDDLDNSAPTLREGLGNVFDIGSYANMSKVMKKVESEIPMVSKPQSLRMALASFKPLPKAME